jgi:hypothetical protein
MDADVGVLGVVVVPPVPVVGVVVVVPGTEMLDRGVKEIGELIPLGATAAARSRSSARFTCNTITSMTTSDLGLSRSATNFSAKATLSASPRTMMAFCACYVKIF